MVVRCHPHLRQNILKNTHLLKDVKNEEGKFFIIKPQLPEPRLTERKEQEEKMKEIKKANAQIPDENKEARTKVYIKSGKLYINDTARKVHIRAPTVADLFNTTKEEQAKMAHLTFARSPAYREHNSVFQGHAITVKNATDVKLAYRRIKQLYPESDHIIMAYSYKDYTGYQDNGEYGAAKRIDQIIANAHRKNIAVFVTRDYSSIHLGQ